MIETHPNPKTALKDGMQSLTFNDFRRLMGELKPLVEAIERTIQDRQFTTEDTQSMEVHRGHIHALKSSVLLCSLRFLRGEKSAYHPLRRLA